MAKRSVDVIIRAKDQASKKFGKVERATIGVGRAFRNLAIAAGAGLGIAGIIKGFKEMVKVASDAEEISSKFDAVFREEASAAENFGKKLATATNRSKIEIKDFLASLQDTFVPLGYARDEARQMSQTMVQLAIDVASFQNKADADVLRDFQSAIVGNHETVRKYGIIITQAALDQELINMGFKGGAKDASEQQKALARLNTILKGTSDAQGDAIRTANSFANQWKGLKAQIKDGAAAIGGKLLPAITGFVKRFRDGMIVAAVVAENWRIVMDMVFLKAGLAAVGFWEDTKHWITVVIPDLLLWFGRNWKQIFTDIWNFTRTVVTNMFTNIVDFFKAVWSWMKGEGFDFTWTSLLEGFESTLEEMPEIVKRELTNTEKAMREELDKLKGEMAEKIAERFNVEFEAEALKLPELKDLKIDITDQAKETVKIAKAQDKALKPLESRFLTFAPGSRFNRTENNTAQTARNTGNIKDVLKAHGIVLKEIAKMLGNIQLPWPLRTTNFK